MSLVLLLPAGLLALLALAVPLLLHLRRQAETRPLLFAALRWLPPQARPRRRLRFEQLLLLAVRLLLVALLALLLAQPAWRSEAAPRGWRLLHPQLGLAGAARLRLQVEAGQAEWRWLAPGFPPIASQAPPPAAGLPIASLLREADALLPDGASLAVHLPAVLDGLDGSAIQLSRTLDWQLEPGVTAADPPAPQPPTRTLVVRHAPERVAELAWLRAAVAAWNVADTGSVRLDAAAALPCGTALCAGALPAAAAADWLAWLAPGEVPEELRARVRAGAVLLLAHDAALPADAAAATVPDGWRDERGQPLLRSTGLGAGRIVQLAVPLAAAALPQLLDADFPSRLQAVLAPPAAPARAAAAAVQALVGGVRSPAALPAQPLDQPLVLLAVLLFALERLLASRAPRPEPQP